MIINARVSNRDGASYVLSCRGAQVGWLRAHAIGFAGFRDADAAADAANIAGEILADWYRLRWRTSAPLPWEGAVEPASRVEVDGVVVGRLLPSTPLDDDVEAPAFELRVPGDLWVATGIELAQRIWAALCEAGVAAGCEPTLPPAG